MITEEPKIDPGLLSPSATNGTHAPSRALTRSWKVIAASAAVAIVAGFGAGYAGSYLHPGPKGPRGNTGFVGATGPAGAQGTTGAAGAPAPVNQGVCFTYHTVTQSGVQWVDSVTIVSPSKHSDGTTYCSIGQYVPVAPQS